MRLTDYQLYKTQKAYFFAEYKPDIRIAPYLVIPKHTQSNNFTKWLFLLKTVIW